MVQPPAEFTSALLGRFTNPTKSRPTPERRVTVATKPFGRDCGRIGNNQLPRPAQKVTSFRRDFAVRTTPPSVSASGTAAHVPDPPRGAAAFRSLS
jgi:hypothetical protein